MLTEKFFNTAGPQIPEDHYTLSSFQRFNWPELEGLIAQKRYFILHAPRQTGKTTALAEIMDFLNEQGHYCALYANIETAQTTRNDVAMGMDAICESIADELELTMGDTLLQEWVKENRKKAPHQKLTSMLNYWCRHSEKPVVLMLDEVDALIGDTLISLLRQLRSGYKQRPKAAPHSLILCGVRDIKDYRIHQSDGDIITGGSAFNIKAESLTLGNFSQDEIQQLYQQHIDESGQQFDEQIYSELWLDTA